MSATPATQRVTRSQARLAQTPAPVKMACLEDAIERGAATEPKPRATRGQKADAATPQRAGLRELTNGCTPVKTTPPPAKMPEACAPAAAPAPAAPSATPAPKNIVASILFSPLPPLSPPPASPAAAEPAAAEPPATPLPEPLPQPEEAAVEAAPAAEAEASVEEPAAPSSPGPLSPLPASAVRALPFVPRNVEVKRAVKKAAAEEAARRLAACSGGSPGSTALAQHSLTQLKRMAKAASTEARGRWAMDDGGFDASLPHAAFAAPAPHPRLDLPSVIMAPQPQLTHNLQGLPNGAGRHIRFGDNANVDELAAAMMAGLVLRGVPPPCGTHVHFP